MKGKASPEPSGRDLLSPWARTVGCLLLLKPTPYCWESRARAGRAVPGHSPAQGTAEAAAGEGYLKTMRCATSSDCQYSSGTKLVWTRKQLSVRSARASTSSGAGAAAPAGARLVRHGPLGGRPPPLSARPGPAYRRLAARRPRRPSCTAPSAACGAAPPPASAPAAPRPPPPARGMRGRGGRDSAATSVRCLQRAGAAALPCAAFR